MGDRCEVECVAVDGVGEQSALKAIVANDLAKSARRVVPESPDMTHAEAVRRLLVRCCWLLRNRPSRLVLDLHEVERADTKLVASLVTIYRLGRAFSVPVEILPSRAVENALNLCQLHRLIERTRPFSGT